MKYLIAFTVGLLTATILSLLDMYIFNKTIGGSIVCISSCIAFQLSKDAYEMLIENNSKK